MPKVYYALADRDGRLPWKYFEYSAWPQMEMGRVSGWGGGVGGEVLERLRCRRGWFAEGWAAGFGFGGTRRGRWLVEAGWEGMVCGGGEAHAVPGFVVRWVLVLISRATDTGAGPGSREASLVYLRCSGSVRTGLAGWTTSLVFPLLFFVDLESFSFGRFVFQYTLYTERDRETII